MGRNLVGCLLIAALTGAGAFAQSAIEVNVAAPELAKRGPEEWINARPQSLAQLRGRVVVLHFWTYGCVNCIRNYPAYNDWHERFQAKGLAVIGVHAPETDAERDAHKVRKSVREAKLKYPVVLDADAAIWSAWGNQWWPCTYLIDKRGVVRFRWEGELNWNKIDGEAIMREKIEQLLAEAAPNQDRHAAANPRDRRALLQQAQSWMYQLQGLDEPKAVAALAASNYPLLVVEPEHNLKAPSRAARLVEALKSLPNGQPRLLLAYLDVGQAEEYRDYWKPDWKAPTRSRPGRPEFLLAIDPDGWSESYQVAYWDPRWKEIWLGEAGLVCQLARAGFDGIYLDWVAAYEDRQVMRAARRAGLDPQVEMLKFIEELGAAGKQVTADFLVIAQNAPELIDKDPNRYGKAVDALAVEDTWFSGKGGADWNDPNGGDIPNRDDEESSTAGRLAQYKKFLQRNLPVFTVDYCVKPENAALVYREARRSGLRPLVTRVALSRMTTTPPPAEDRQPGP